MKKTIILFLILSCCLSAHAQTEIDSTKLEGAGITETELQIAKDAFLRMFLSETYKASNKASLRVIEKIDGEIPIEFTYEKEWLTWITENLRETKFKSVQEAMDLRALNLELTGRLVNENTELFELMYRASKKQRFEVTKPEREF